MPVVHGLTEARAEEARRALDAVLKGQRAAELESTTLDFKEDSGDKKKTLRDLAEAAVCFANASGGVIILGVRDVASGPDALRGTSLNVEEARRGIHERTKPPMLVNAFEHKVESVALIIVEVDGSGTEVWSDSRGRFTVRVGTDCVAMGQAAVQRLAEERKGFDLSSEATDAILSDVSAVALGLAREQLGRLGDPERSRLVALSDEDLLRRLGVLTEDGHLRAAGAWMFCSPIAPGTDRLIYEYRVTPSGEPQVVERLAAPLLVTFTRALELVSARRVATPVNLPDGQQLSVDDFPEAAVREAVANAVVHRDYRANGPVVVVHSPDVFHVTSPGPLVPGVTVENILSTPSRPRNRLLARVFRTLGLVEELGVGVDRMYREMIRSGRDAPAFEANFDRVRVVLTGGAPARGLVRYAATLPDDTDALLVLLHLCHRRTVRADAIAPVLQKTEREAAHALAWLASDEVGMLEPTRETFKSTSPTYRLRSDVVKILGPAVRYRRRTQDDIDRKIIAHVREYGRVTNATVRNLLDLSTPRASAILKDLRERAILTKTSDVERGPSVEYGPGPSFPSEEPPERPADLPQGPTLFDFEDQ